MEIAQTIPEDIVVTIAGQFGLVICMDAVCKEWRAAVRARCRPSLEFVLPLSPDSFRDACAKHPNWQAAGASSWGAIASRFAHGVRATLFVPRTSLSAFEASMAHVMNAIPPGCIAKVVLSMYQRLPLNALVCSGAQTPVIDASHAIFKEPLGAPEGAVLVAPEGTRKMSLCEAAVDLPLNPGTPYFSQLATRMRLPSTLVVLNMAVKGGAPLTLDDSWFVRLSVECPALEELCIDGNPYVTPVGLNAVLDACPLTRLSVGSCRRLMQLIPDPDIAPFKQGTHLALGCGTGSARALQMLLGLCEANASHPIKCLTLRSSSYDARNVPEAVLQVAVCCPFLVYLQLGAKQCATHQVLRTLLVESQIETLIFSSPEPCPTRFVGGTRQFDVPTPEICTMLRERVGRDQKRNTKSGALGTFILGKWKPASGLRELRAIAVKATLDALGIATGPCCEQPIAAC